MRRRRFLILGLARRRCGAGRRRRLAAFSTEIAEARARTRGRSEVFESRFGAMEYAVAGTGPPVLMIHGTGGGFDQGLAFTEPLVAAGWQIMAPSRFGYLRSDFPDDPSSENQADAFVDLLDRSGSTACRSSADRPGALGDAVRDPPPDRCAALVALVPAAFAGPPPRPPTLGGSSPTAKKKKNTDALARGNHRLRTACDFLLAGHDDGRGRDDRHAARHRP